MELSTISPAYRQECMNEQIYKCPNCSSKNSGYIEKEASALTLISTVLAILLFKFYAMMILPLIIEASKTCIKKCVKCDHILEKQELLSVPSLTDKVLSFKCGGCAIVVSRKYAIIITIGLIILYFFLPSSPHTAILNPGDQMLDNTKWENYVEDCGRQALLNNGVRARKNFENKYSHNIITWRGSVQSKVDRNRIRDPMVSAALLIKMNPTDAKIEFPDLELIISNEVFHHFRNEIDPLTPMDIIEFKGRFRKMGDEFSYHALDAFEIKNTKEKMDWSQLHMIDIPVQQQSSLRKSEKGAFLQIKPMDVLAQPSSDQGQTSLQQPIVPHSEPVEPAEPLQPAATSQKEVPMQQTEPIQPAQPSEPVPASQLEPPVQQVQPIEPSEPVASTDQVQPSEPVPSQLEPEVQHVQPIEPSEPAPSTDQVQPPAA
jgi:hypothetical protein